MSRPLVLASPADLAEYRAPVDWGALTPAEVAQHAPDETIVLPGEATLRARCSLWWTETPALENERVGAIGHFAATDAASARELLNEACARLSTRGCTIAVGPMDGNTWRRYRLVTEPGSEPPFFLEPTNPPEWPGWFEDAGFAPIAHYSSALATDLTHVDPRTAEREERIASAGVMIRPLDLGAFDDELARIYGVAEVSFQSNFLYTPLPREQFVSQYEAVRPLVEPSLVFLAEHEGKPVGFSFSLPDAAELTREGGRRTVVIKTVAVLPSGGRYAGLGSVFVDRTTRAARSIGFTRAIHALMHDSNRSRAISDRTGGTMRRYALFARPLA